MKIAVVGATGIVGRKMLEMLSIFNYLDDEIELFATANSAGSIINVNNKCFSVKELNFNNLSKHYDFALFSAGAVVSKKWAKEFVKRGAVVIDNSSAFRRYKKCPLVVPEINIHDVNMSTKIISNPNCSTIGASLPIYALSKKYKIKRIIISTYQAVSGAGKRGADDLINDTNVKFNYKIKNNLIPQIDRPLQNGYTYEEDKMEFELKKILHCPDLKISSTCVRVPILNCHSESINIEFKQKPTLNRIKEILGSFDGITLFDDLDNNIYPMPILADGKSDVFVGRIRRDTSNKNSINMFISFDNLLKGAALNAVQILDNLVKKNKK